MITPNFEKPLEQYNKKQLTKIVNLVKGPYSGRIPQNGYQDRIDKIWEHINELMSENNYSPIFRRNIHEIEQFMDDIIIYYNSCSTALIVNKLYQKLRQKDGNK